MMNDEMVGGGWLMALVWLAIVVIPFWRICSKAGYPGALALIMAIPLANLIFLYYLAFATWPIHKGGTPGAGGMGGPPPGGPGQ